jgi:hypothetical protein
VTTPTDERKSYKPILCLDFDGVIHSYTSPWVDARTIPDPVVPGFFKWAVEAEKHFNLVIYSSRSKDLGAIDAMRKWLSEQWEATMSWVGGVPYPKFEFAHEKPKAFLTLDDRGLNFKGDFEDQELDPGKLREFKPWNR